MILYFISRKKLLGRLTWIIDIFASLILLSGTYIRTIILDGKTWSYDCEAALNSEYGVVSKYFVFSLTSWLALVVLETKSCVFITKAYFGKISLAQRTLSQWFKFLFFFLLAAHSVLVMLHFCTDVHQTFEHLTEETWLIFYYWVAAVAKTFSVFIQGVFFCSWIIDHPIKFLPENKLCERKVMFRMAFVNAVGLCHSLGLAYFGIFDGGPLWTSGKKARIASLAIDFCYRIALCCWYHKNSYCCLAPALQQFGVLLCCFIQRTIQAIVLAIRVAPNQRTPPIVGTDSGLGKRGFVISAYKYESVYSVVLYNGTEGVGNTIRKAQVNRSLRHRYNSKPDELVISSLNKSRRLFMPKYEDHRHLLDPENVMTENTYLRAPPLQVAECNLSENTPEVVGGVRTRLSHRGVHVVY